MRADFSKKKQESVLSGAKQIFMATSVLPLSICRFPRVCSLDRPTTCSQGKTTCVILNLGLSLRFVMCEHRGQCPHNLFGFGNWTLTSNMPYVQHYRCRSYTFRNGTWGIRQTRGLSIKAFSLCSAWSKEICSSHSTSVSVPYSFHVQNFSAF